MFLYAFQQKAEANDAKDAAVNLMMKAEKLIAELEESEARVRACEQMTMEQAKIAKAAQIEAMKQRELAIEAQKNK